MHEDLMALWRTVHGAVIKNPDWADALLQAVTAGLQDAIREANRQRGQYDIALRSALGLLDTKRMTPEVQEAPSRSIVATLTECGEKGLSKVERGFIKNYREGGGDPGDH